jgi:hypothetical protein
MVLVLGLAFTSNQVWARPLPLPLEDQDLVNQAIDLGVSYLKDHQQPSGSWADEKGSHQVGYAALPALTLLNCGVPRTDPLIKQAASFVRSKWAKLEGTYELSLAILFLDRLGERKDKPLIRAFALRLIAGQSVTGGWGYSCAVLNSINQDDLWSVLHRKTKKLRRLSLPAGIRDLPVLQEPDRLGVLEPTAKPTDNSNTMFALLAVWAARRHNVPAQRTLNLIVRRFQTSQNGDGSWGYAYKRGGGVGDSPPMNCVGLLGLALGHRLADKSGSKAKSLLLLAARTSADIAMPCNGSRMFALFTVNQVWEALQEGKPVKQDAKLLNGFTALQRHIGQPVGRMKDLPMPNLYFLWSVERAAVIFGVSTIGGRDWYRWGAEQLVANQKPDGHWEGSSYPGSSPTIDTCMALLFLRRANLAKDLSSGLRVKPREPAPTKPPPKPVTPEPSVAKSPVVTPPSNPEPAPKTNPSVPPSEPRKPASAPEEAGTNPLGFILGGVGLLCLLGGGAFMFLMRRPRSEEPEDRPARKKTSRPAEKNGQSARKSTLGKKRSPRRSED